MCVPSPPARTRGHQKQHVAAAVQRDPQNPPRGGAEVGRSTADGGVISGERSLSSSPPPHGMSCSEQTQAGR